MARLRVTRVLGYLAFATVVASLAASVAWLFCTLTVRPLDGVEGDVLFEADRLRDGLVLYTDPLQGAFDYGPVPARYLVLYPPLWSAVLSRIPFAAAALGARVLASLSWFGVLAFMAWRAPQRRPALVAAAAIAGTWVLALYGASGRPDAPALAACGFALERATRRAPSFDVLTGVLFALAAWLKPNVIGVVPGVVIGALYVSRSWRAVLPGVLGGVAFSVAMAVMLSSVSHGAWLHHLLASTGQPPNASLWLSQLASRGPFVALPFAFVIGIGLRARAWVPLAALVTSLVWTIVSLAKIGSASNYLMEPCLAALAVIAVAPLPPARPFLVAAALVQGLYNGVANVRSALEHITTARAQAAALVRVRRGCSGVVLADEPGLERMLNSRIIQTPFQSTHLAPKTPGLTEAWSSDVSRPEVTCLVMEDDLLARPLTAIDPVFDRFGVPLRQVLAGRFDLASRDGGYWIYRLRP